MINKINLYQRFVAVLQKPIVQRLTYSVVLVCLFYILAYHIKDPRFYPLTPKNSYDNLSSPLDTFIFGLIIWYVVQLVLNTYLINLILKLIYYPLVIISFQQVKDDQGNLVLFQILKFIIFAVLLFFHSKLKFKNKLFDYI